MVFKTIFLWPYSPKKGVVFQNYKSKHLKYFSGRVCKAVVSTTQADVPKVQKMAMSYFPSWTSDKTWNKN